MFGQTHLSTFVLGDVHVVQPLIGYPTDGEESGALITRDVITIYYERVYLAVSKATILQI